MLIARDLHLLNPETKSRLELLDFIDGLYIIKINFPLGHSALLHMICGIDFGKNPKDDIPCDCCDNKCNDFEVSGVNTCSYYSGRFGVSPILYGLAPISKLKEKTEIRLEVV